MASALRRARALLPWFVAVVLLAYVLAPYRHGQARAELVLAFERAPIWTAGVILIGAVVAFLADTFATWRVLSWRAPSLGFYEVGVIRGLSYFFATVNYALGQAATILVLARQGMKASRATGVVLFIMGINVIVLLLFAGASIATGAAVPPHLRTVLCAALALLPVYAVLVRLAPAPLAKREVLAPLFEFSPAQYLAAVACRVPHVATIMLIHLGVMYCFGVRVPLTFAAIYLPIVFAVAALPISAQGLGTSQLLVVEFFSRFAPGDPAAQRATVLAYSLYTIAAWLPLQVTIGAICLFTDYGKTLRSATRADAPSLETRPS